MSTFGADVERGASINNVATERPDQVVRYVPFRPDPVALWADQQTWRTTAPANRPQRRCQVLMTVVIAFQLAAARDPGLHRRMMTADLLMVALTGHYYMPAHITPISVTSGIGAVVFTG